MHLLDYKAAHTMSYEDDRGLVLQSIG
jgi:hypothetical protein